MEGNGILLKYMVDVFILLGDARLGIVGGFVAYIFDYSKSVRAKDKGEDVVFVFRWTSLFINMALGGFVGYNVGLAMGSDVWLRSIWVSMSGLTAYNILLLAESRFPAIIIDKILKDKK